MRILNNGIAVLENDTHVSHWVEECGQLCHDKTVEQFILPLLKEGDWVVDGGALIGDHTIAYAEQVGPTGMVFAFEPNPNAFECLEFNMRNHPNVICQQMALSYRQRRCHLTENQNAGAAYIDDKEGDVRCTALDSIPLERLNLIKLDLEGHELFALRGMTRTIEKHKPIIIVEMNRGALARNYHRYHNILDFFRIAGYECSDLCGNPDLNREQFDLLAKPLLTDRS